ncbi:hypothetical protein Tco_1105487 [Tanacetum coccineum]
MNPFVLVPPNGLGAKNTQELNELWEILAMIDSRLKNIGHTWITIPPTAPFRKLLNDFMNSPDVFKMDDLESDNESMDTPLVSPFLDPDDELGDGEVINELDEKFVAYFDPFLLMNIITHKAYNIIMVEGLESTGRNLVAIVRDYVFVGSFTYVTDFVVLGDIGEFVVSDMSDVVMGRPF